MERRERGSIEIASHAEHVWRVCTHYEAFPEFIPGIASCARDDDGTWHWTGRAFGLTRRWRSWEIERVEGERLVWSTDDPMVPDGKVVVRPLGAGRSCVSIEMHYEPRTWLDRVLVNRLFARVRLWLDLRHFRRRVEQGD